MNYVKAIGWLAALGLLVLMAGVLIERASANFRANV